MGKILIFIGCILILAGVIVSFKGTIPWLGKLPGDIVYKSDNFQFYFPLTTSIVISVIVSILIWLYRAL